jgi:SagB-type dehydrogenase family enzyme
VTLPAGELPPVSLADALRERGCGRGDLGGTVTAAELGTLLWSSYAPSRPQHRPYPSAGAQYVARLRLIARAVDGLEPGQYEVDPVSRRLLPLCPLPGDDELAQTSMWFDRDAHEAGRVQVATLPALLGLYVEVTALRQRYGLRALRFALLEAGHLAQYLALAAAAAGLSLGIIGGFYDDVAHEVFMLDGVDDVLAYLLPVGRVDR